MIGEKIVVNPTTKKDTKNPDKVDFDNDANKHPKPISAKIKATKQKINPF